MGTTSGKKAKILLAKPGLDPHDMGMLILSRKLRDAGYEVVYQGLHQFPEAIVNSAIQEDVDFIFLSTHHGLQVPATQEVVQLLNERGAQDIIVACGGAIPPRDFPLVKEAGAKGVFGPGVSIKEVIDFIEENI